MSAAEEVAGALAPFVGARAADPYISQCAVEAVEMVVHYVGVEKDAIPASVFQRACVEVGADLYHRRSARNGIAGFEDTDITSAPVRINRDPLVPARPILAPYMKVGIA